MLIRLLSRILESYFRRRWLYLLPTVFMLALGVAYTTYLPPAYQVEATIYVEQETLLSSLTSFQDRGLAYVTPAQATVGELIQLFQSDAVVRAIIEQTDLEAEMSGGPKVVEEIIAEARDAIWPQELGNNLVLITARHEDPQIAYQFVSSTIDTYIQWKTNIARNESVAAQSFFVELVETYRSQVEPERKALDDYLIAHPPPLAGLRPPIEVAAIDRLQAAITLAEERLRVAENNEENARLALIQAESDIKQSYLVVDAPIVPHEPETSLKTVVLGPAIFLAVGLFLSIGGIVGGAVLDRSVRLPADVKHELGLPLLAVVPASSD